MQDVLFGENLRNPPRWRFIASNPGLSLMLQHFLMASNPINAAEKYSVPSCLPCGETHRSDFLRARVTLVKGSVIRVFLGGCVPIDSWLVFAKMGGDFPITFPAFQSTLCLDHQGPLGSVTRVPSTGIFVTNRHSGTFG